MKRLKTLGPWFRQSGAFQWVRRPKYTEPQFEPYVKAIGQLLLAWNDLHERLATLFVTAMGGGYVNRPLAVWHSIRSDMGRRQLLGAAIGQLSDREIGQRLKVAAEIDWILQQTNQLEGYRDDSAHTPMRSSELLSIFSISNLFSVPNIFAIGAKPVLPDTAFQNPRAIRIDTKNKDLLIEYKYARERLIVLRDYAIAIDAAWSNAQLPWPDRPDLPERKPRRRRRPRATSPKPK
jgi:hypothetical protein